MADLTRASDHLAGVLATLREPGSARLLIGRQSCHCCGRGGVDARLIRAVLDLAEALGVDLEITSGYRCPEHNAKIPGASTRSKHMAGSAVDIAIPTGIDPLDYYRAACGVVFLERGGIGIDQQRHFVHHDTGAQRRWAYKDGKQVSWDEVFPSTSRE